MRVFADTGRSASEANPYVGNFTGLIHANESTASAAFSVISNLVIRKASILALSVIVNVTVLFSGLIIVATGFPAASKAVPSTSIANI